MGQSRPLFLYFPPFLIAISIIQIEKSLDGVLGIWTRGRRIVGIDDTTELWRAPFADLFISDHRYLQLAFYICCDLKAVKDVPYKKHHLPLWWNLESDLNKNRCWNDNSESNFFILPLSQLFSFIQSAYFCWPIKALPTLLLFLVGPGLHVKSDCT